MYIRKRKLLQKNPQCLKKLTYVKKCQYETLKQKMIECLICFPNLKIIQTSLHFLHEGIWKSVLGGHKTLLVLDKLPPGAGTVFPSICMDQFVNQNINLVLIGKHH